jgi:hypothetical protein
MSRTLGEAKRVATCVGSPRSEKEISMRLRSIRTLAAGGAALVLLAGGATALAKSGSSSADPATKRQNAGRGLFAPTLRRELVARSGARRVVVGECRRVAVSLPGPLQAAADYLGISVDQLTSELRGGASLAEVANAHGKSVDGLLQVLVDAAKSQLDKSVAAGDITVDQEQHMLDGLRSHLADLVNSKFGAEFPPPEPPLGDPIAAAADYLGLSADGLAQELQAGKSLADVARERGKAVGGLEQALIDAAKSALDKSVAGGDITAAEEQQVLGQLNSQIDDFVNGNADLSIRIGNEGLGVQVRIGRRLGEGPYETAAAYLGLPLDQLIEELQGGKSLADIAAERGKSVDGLKQALISAGAADSEESADELVNQKGLPFLAPPCLENGAAADITSMPVFGLSVRTGP